jgi:transposase
MASKPTGKKVGRPSKYKPEYCEALIKHMSEGLSFETFGAVIGTCRDTVFRWVHEFPEFSDAKKMGDDICQLWWERMGISGLWGSKDGSFNAAVYIFNMKNRFKWTDRSDLKITGNFQEKKEDHDLLRAVDRKKLIALARQQEKKAG